MSNDVRQEVSALIERMRCLRQEQINLADWGSGMKLGPPASLKDLLAAERLWQFEFPPSYRVFLEMHNGWLQFWPDWSLLGVSGQMTDKMLRDAKRSLKSYSKVLFHHEGQLEEVKQKRTKKTNMLDICEYPVLATDFNGGVMVFDRNQRASDGECAILELRYASIQYRFRNFSRLLRYAISDVKQDLREFREDAAVRTGKKHAGREARRRSH